MFINVKKASALIASGRALPTSEVWAGCVCHDVVPHWVSKVTAMSFAPSPATPHTQEWLDNEDFLQQCVPRLGRLIEVGLSGDGRLPEELFQRCLDLNDHVQGVLEGKPLDVVRAAGRIGSAARGLCCS